MKLVIFFALIFNFNLVLGADKPEFKYNLPTSDVPSASDGGYKFPCAIAQLNPTNLSHVSYQNSENNQITEYNITGSTKFISNGVKAVAHCGSGYYVFDPENKTDKSKTAFSFELTCENGALKRKNGTEFCDKKCDILPIKSSGYRFLDDILLPGQTTTIKCPIGSITQTGKNEFDVTCEQNGLITKKTPECFIQKTACEFKGEYFKDGTKLQCNSHLSIGIYVLGCNNASWNRDENTCNDTCFNGCKLNVADLNFKYDNLNEKIQIILDEEISIQEITDHCKEQDGTIKEECKSKPIFCKYKGVEYGQQDRITLKCNDEKERNFQCFGEKFVNMPLTGLAGVEIDDPTCKGAPVVKEDRIPPKNTRSINSNKTLRDYELEVYRSKNQ